MQRISDLFTRATAVGCESSEMNTNTLITMLLAAAFTLSTGQGIAADKTVGEKSAEVWDKTKATTKDVTQKVVKTTRQAVNRVEAAVREPDADARKVDVKVNDKGVQMPKNLAAGKTAFVVTNTGKEAHNFEIEGSGIDKSFWFALGPNQTKTMQVNLKPGTYEAVCTAEAHGGKEQKVQIAVK